LPRAASTSTPFAVGQPVHDRANDFVESHRTGRVVAHELFERPLRVENHEPVGGNQRADGPTALVETARQQLAMLGRGHEQHVFAAFKPIDEKHRNGFDQRFRRIE
jgi:hypothetical protein